MKSYRVKQILLAALLVLALAGLSGCRIFPELETRLGIKEPPTCSTMLGSSSCGCRCGSPAP